jgi:hypothetical protein
MTDGFLCLRTVLVFSSLPSGSVTQIVAVFSTTCPNALAQAVVTIAELPVTVELAIPVAP